MKTDKTEKIERIIEKSMLVVLSACGVYILIHLVAAIIELIKM